MWWTRSGSPPVAARPRPTSSTSLPQPSTIACAARREGITSWGRFPLRMLSLQQTQRFADVLAAADLRAPRREDPGCLLPRLLGRQQRHAQPDPDATSTHRRARLPRTRTCPLATRSCCAARSAGPTSSPCASTRLDGLSITCAQPTGAPGAAVPCRSGSSTRRSTARSRPWSSAPWTRRRASRCRPPCAGFYGAPAGRCSVPTHGFTYAPRSRTPNGCLFPGCTATTGPAGPRPIPVRADGAHAGRAAPAARQSRSRRFALRGPARRPSGPLPVAPEDHRLVRDASRAGRTDPGPVPQRRTAFPRPGPRVGRSLWSRDTDVLARSASPDWRLAV